MQVWWPEDETPSPHKSYSVLVQLGPLSVRPRVSRALISLASVIKWHPQSLWTSSCKTQQLPGHPRLAYKKDCGPMCFSEVASSPSSLIYGRGHGPECSRSYSPLLYTFLPFLSCTWWTAPMLLALWILYHLPTLFTLLTNYIQAYSCMHTYCTVLTAHIIYTHNLVSAHTSTILALLL